MNISYTEPLSRAWNRMKSMLFRPFHIESWFVLGASAFLAGLFTHSGAFNGWNNNLKSRSGGVDVQAEHTLDRARESFMHVLANPAILAMIAVAMLFLLVVVVVLAWVSARAEFVFLDCVATRRAHFMEPWRRLGALGRSLFLWRAAFSFAYLPPVIVIGIPFVGAAVKFYESGDLSLPSIAGMALGLCIGFVMLVVLAWISMVMDMFVVPLMYRYGEGARASWSRFGRLLWSRPGSFFAFTIFYVMLTIVTVLGLAIAGVGTCCIGLVLMIIPYVGTVVLLPVVVTARGLGPEFLAQFGDEWRVFPVDEPDDDVATPPATSAPDAEPRPLV